MTTMAAMTAKYSHLATASAHVISDLAASVRISYQRHLVLECAIVAAQRVGERVSVVIAVEPSDSALLVQRGVT